jgi:hypothetical protein
MTVAHNQSEQLAEMIKVEAQKTIQMLEMFMQVNKDNLPVDSKPNLHEIQHKTNEDLATIVRNVQTITNDDTESSEDEFGYTYEDNLFEGMDNKYHSVSPYPNKNGQYKEKDRRVPFSKYVENELKRSKASYSFHTQANRSAEIDDIIRATVNMRSSCGRNEEVKLKDSILALKKNRLKIHKTQQHGFNPGKFFNVKLKPLQNNKEKLKREQGKDIPGGKSEDKKMPYVSRKNIPDKGHEYFYEYQFSMPEADAKDPLRKSLNVAKNREIFDSL